MTTLESRQKQLATGRYCNRECLAKTLVIAAMTVGAGISATPALAQSDEASGALAFEEIIVTATRRETSLQDTALTIQAIQAADLVNIGATNLEDIVGLVPGLNVTGPEDLTIRGLRSSLDERSGTISTTSLYLDETPIDHQFRIFDVSRVEILKGPQGSLYGAGAMGGTIRMVTNKPNSEAFFGEIDVDYSSTSNSDDDNHEINAVVNVPLVEDKLAARAVAYQHDYAGFTDDVRLGIEDFDSDEVTGGRLAVRWDASENVSVTGTYLHEDVERGSPSYEQLGLSAYEGDRFFDEQFDETWDVMNLLLDWDLEAASLIVTLTRTENDIDNIFDATRFVNLSFMLPDPPNGGFLNATQVGDTESDTDVGELRLVSNLDSDWSWVVGAFYQKRKESGDASIFVTEVDPDNPSLGFRVGDLDGFTNRDQLADQRVLKETERELAGFGELTYNFTDQWSATAGIRYLDVEQFNQFYLLSTIFGFPAGLGDPLSPIKVSHSDYYTKFRLAYQANNDLLFYFIRSEGFRRGGFNLGAAFGEAFGIPNIPDSFDSDEVTNWELGMHSAWQDGRMILNAAAYYIDWTDIRVGALDPSGLNFTTNGPAADVYGLEAELSYRVSANFDIAATLALTSTELSSESVDEVLEDLGVPYPDNLTLAPKGEDLPGIPEETFSLTFNYNMPELVSDFDGYARFDGTYTSATYNTYEEGPFSFGRLKMDAYTIANLRLGLARQDWDLSLYVKNHFDERADLFIDQGAFGPNQARRNRPRTVGVNIRKSFE